MSGQLGIAIGIEWEKVEGVTFLDGDTEIRRFPSPRAAVQFLIDVRGSIERIWLLKDAIV